MTLTLCLKYKWFAMIASGEKLEEYRDITPYYAAKFLENGVYRQYDKVKFVMGHDFDTCVIFKNPRIRIGQGLSRFGAEAGKLYYILTWGEMVCR